MKFYDLLAERRQARKWTTEDTARYGARASTHKFWTHQDVANAAKVCRTSYQAMETKGRIPTFKVWRPIIAVLGITEDEFLASMTPDERNLAVANRRGRQAARVDINSPDRITQATTGFVSEFVVASGSLIARVEGLFLTDDKSRPIWFEDRKFYIDEITDKVASESRGLIRRVLLRPGVDT